MDYREEKQFAIQIRLSARFDEAYEGDDDGYVWHQKFEQVVRPRLVRAVLAALTEEADWKVTPVSRGLSPEEALELEVEWRTNRG